MEFRYPVQEDAAEQDIEVIVMQDIEVFDKVYRILDKAEPMAYDCGKDCGAACCRRDAFGEGIAPCIYLLPGENEYLRSVGADIRIEREAAEEHDLPEPFGEYVYMAYCNGPESCDRRYCPIQCRTFPLMPQITDEGELVLTYYDDELPYVCPLIEKKCRLSEEFVRAVYEAWEILSEDEPVKELINTGYCFPPDDG